MTKKLATVNTRESNIDWFDRRIVTTVLRWAPFGGLRDEEVFPEFGITAVQLAERFRMIVDGLHQRQRTLTCSDRELLIQAIDHLMQSRPQSRCTAGAQPAACDLPQTRDSFRRTIFR